MIYCIFHKVNQQHITDIYCVLIFVCIIPRNEWIVKIIFKNWKKNFRTFSLSTSYLSRVCSIFHAITLVEIIYICKIINLIYGCRILLRKTGRRRIF